MPMCPRGSTSCGTFQAMAMTQGNKFFAPAS
jgi:hypothetical protein